MKVTNCCGCWSLKTGTIVIGVLSVISAVINVITIASTLSQVDGTKIGNPNLFIIKTIIVTSLMFVIASAAFGILMIVGTIRGIPGLVFPWLATGLTSIVTIVCVSFGLIVIASSVLEVGVLFGILAVCCICFTLQVYLWLVVYSNYKNLLAIKYGQTQAPVIANEGKVFSHSMNPYHEV